MKQIQQIIVPLTIDEIRSKSRKREILYPRYAVIYILHQQGKSNDEIAEFVFCHRTNVYSALKTVQNALQGYNRELREIVERYMNLEAVYRYIENSTNEIN